MKKLDLTKQYKAYYSAPGKPQLLEIGQASFLSIAGKGDPSGKEFADRVQALFTTAYAVKFLCKVLEQDFVVPKLQGQWSFDETAFNNLSLEEIVLKVPRSEWNYRLLLRMPAFVTRQQCNTAVKTVVENKKIALANEVAFYEMEEGRVVQMLHVGPFATEPATLKQIGEFMEQHHLQKNGLHHEIYLSDFRKTAPDKLKTILREPVK